MAVLQTDGEAVDGLRGRRRRATCSTPRCARSIEAAIAAGRRLAVGAPEPPAFAARGARRRRPAPRRRARAIPRARSAYRPRISTSSAPMARRCCTSRRAPAVRSAAPSNCSTPNASPRGLGLPVAYDFRAADIAAGGQGAPLAPVYHRALAAWSELHPPLAVLNLGGVGNLTLIGGGRRAGGLRHRSGQRHDRSSGSGAHRRPARRGRRPGPRAGRSTTRSSRPTSTTPISPAAAPGPSTASTSRSIPVSDLSLEDAAATLTAFAAEAVALGRARLRSRAPAGDRLRRRPAQSDA